ncbi:unnamed protein product, partial [Pelagomonas calceolata]
HNKTITLSLARSDGGRVLDVVVAAAALVVEPAVPRRLEAVEGARRRFRRLRRKVGVVRANGRDDGRERVRLAYREVREDLAVQVYVCRPQAANQPVVGHAVLSAPRVDGPDPALAHLAFFHLAVAKGVLPGLLDALHRNPEAVRPSAVALGELDELLVLAAREVACGHQRRAGRRREEAARGEHCCDFTPWRGVVLLDAPRRRQRRQPEWLECCGARACGT